MSPHDFAKLLQQSENLVLDFKAEQYRFVKASDDEKSELLKDILCFANASRQSPAHIVIGAREVLGLPAVVVGIQREEQLTDHTLQQFVRGKTNRPFSMTPLSTKATKWRSFVSSGSGVPSISRKTTDD